MPALQRNGKRTEMTPDDMKAARRELRISQRQLGDEIGYTRESIAEFERGGRPIPLVVALAVRWLVNQRRLD